MSKDWHSFFTGKTVTLMGLGLLGRGVGDAAFLAEHCAKLYVTDSKSGDELKTSVAALAKYNNIEFVLGGHENRLFEKVDFVVKGAGVRLDNPFVAHARAQGVPIYMSTALFAHLSGLRTVGVTGTRGKTTTTVMIADILKGAGQKILLGGNLRGVSTLAQLPQAANYDLAVLELDSWQMQGFDELGLSPNISVFTNIYPDHMNYYDGDMERYLRDKTAIFRHQKAGDTLVTTQAMTDLLQMDKAVHKGTWVVASPLPDSVTIQVPGAHNLANAALARMAAKACDVSDAIADAALRAFTGVEGRLQFIGVGRSDTGRERRFYNDSNATTQEATLAALNAFPPEKIVLIFGGADKGLPMDGLIGFIAQHHIRSVLIKGTGSDRVLQTLPALTTVGSMPEAVSRALALSAPGDHIVLSPAFASFGVFKNEYDRSDQFLAETKKHIEGEPHAT
jgi:UDP-N-acetylmuramoylalanine--D-glutamate ligase